jgi:hypothetical protein
MTDYKKSKSFEERLSESNRIIEKYPDRLPIIVEKKNTCKLNDIDKNKFLVPSDMALTQFIYIIRKRIKLNSNSVIKNFRIDKKIGKCLHIKLIEEHFINISKMLKLRLKDA